MYQEIYWLVKVLLGIIAQPVLVGVNDKNYEGFTFLIPHFMIESD